MEFCFDYQYPSTSKKLFMSHHLLKSWKQKKSAILAKIDVLRAFSSARRSFYTLASRCIVCTELSDF